jgi:hypothetical protein
MSGTMLSDLAGSAGNYVLMTFATTLRVIGGPKSVGNYFGFLKDKPVVVEGSARHNRILV